MSFTHRLANAGDLPALTALMNAAIAENQRAFLEPRQIAASFAVMGLDTQLIADRTYFVIEEGSVIAGCGGWSKRATLFGGDHSAGRDAALLDPKSACARIRAMYTHPAFTRRGVGRLIMDLCEKAAAFEGFACAELAATLSGEPLYRACGYEMVERFDADTPEGVPVPLLKMRKRIV